MQLKRSSVLQLRVWGRNACFTRPEMKVERVSYDVMTPSAARGILEAVLWKPAMKWQVTKIDVLKPIRWESVRRNEIGATMSPRGKGIFIEDERQQRAGLFLRDVEYVIHAYFEMTDRAGPGDSVVKFEEMFRRRAAKGQCFHRPYFGCREFSADFELVDATGHSAPVADSRELGWMLYDMDYEAGEPMPRFFNARLDSGSVTIPPFDGKEVRG